MQSKREFFHSGVDNQKRPDIVIDLRRAEVEKIKLWTREQKTELKQFMEDAESTFKIFKQEILKAAK